MIVQAFVFYLFAALTVTSAVVVITARNPVHSVLFLILAFFNAAGLMVLLGAEFLAMILVVVYVGAVAVLFLFVVMMLDINLTRLRQGFLEYLPLGGLIGVVLLAELVVVLVGWQVSPEAANVGLLPTPAPESLSNTHALGQVLYTQYLYLFQVAGMVLLVAMIGAIVLTLRAPRANVRRQNISRQLARRAEQEIELKKVQPGSGV